MSSKANQYQKKTPREHVLLRPDTYIGDIELTTEDMWISENEKIIKKEISYVPGFLKTFDELLVNSRDASVNDKTCNTIKVEYNLEEGWLSVYNNGQDGIPVEEHPEHKTLVPSMIFGELLTSSNYDDNKKRTTGGRNGYGAKLANIFSKKFEVEIGDSKSNKKFIQSWEENMSITNKAKVTKYSAKNSYVKVTYHPDFEKLNVKNGLDKNHMALFKRRCIDIAGTSCISRPEALKLFFNEEKLNVTSFKKYIEVSYPDDTLYFDDFSDRYEIGVLYKPDQGNESISFVNSISTHRGGTHVNNVTEQIIKMLINEHISKKNKGVKVSNALIKESLVFFINTVIENPAFSSQTKDTLTTKVSNFGSSYKPNQNFIKKLAKSGIVEKVVKLAEFKESAGLKKSDGKKQVKLKGIPKLDDANKAGTKEANQCSLILTEGDSAKAFAMAGLGIVGRDHFGVFPLKGKLLNVREASVKVIGGNDEINFLKQIIGLKQNTDYSIEENFNQLRYGRIIILTDQDVDGSHIKGLLINFFHFLWPSLVKRKGFITSLATPIVKAFKGKNVKVFYNLTEYDDWRKKSSKGWKVKYYKGLGTSTSKEAKEYFLDIDDKLINYYWKEVKEENDDEFNKIDPNDDAITKAFSKKRADDRKEWLMEYDKSEILTYEQREVDYPEFIDKDMIHFSNDDLERSIPNIMDGLKPSQRKILYGSYLRKLDKDEVKVAQLAGFVSDKAAYHHGEASLTGAIVGLAQDYVGSNNINILKPNGQFGTRVRGGKDSASPRYIWTKLAKLTPLIFRVEDNPILKQQDDDGLPIEPVNYAPIIPMILVNGSEGIGTGFSTKIPPYHPIDIINNLLNLLNDKSIKTMKPWWNKFKGTITKIDKNNFESHGKYILEKDKLIINELPIGEWTTNYKEFLERELVKESNKKNRKTIRLIGYTDNNTDTNVHFELKFNPGKLSKINDIEKSYRLVKKHSTTNMHLYGVNHSITKYNSINEILEEYYYERLLLYKKRREYQLNILKDELDMISYKVKFIMLVIDKKLKINNRKKADIESKLFVFKFPKYGKEPSYQYLLGMPIYSLTFEKLEELKNQMKSKETEYNKLEKISPEEMWKNELNHLLKEYKKWNEEKIKDDEDTGKNNKRKKTKKKKKKKTKNKKKKKRKSKKKKSLFDFSNIF